MSAPQRQARLLEAVSPVWGPPVARDGYRDRNIVLTRSKMRQMKIDRKLALKDGDTRMADALTVCIDGLRDTLNALEC